MHQILERINRWKSAFRMFDDKPFLGFGPGTYMFKYASYQMSYEKTIISTNAGDMGNAHSEYFGPLSEQGLFGMITYLGLIITILVVAIRRYYKIKDERA
jgi:putative inorganic carbon (HCO3(-)) transporter